MNSKFDIIVIGAGPGGYVAAIRAAQLGARVALIERDKVGGTCLNRGCIPTKSFAVCVNFYEKMKKAGKFGITAENISIDLSKVMDRKDKVVKGLVLGLELLLRKNKIDLIRGEARVTEPGKVEVSSNSGNNKILSSEKIIMAVGASAGGLPGFDLDGKEILSTDDMLACQAVPKKLNIIGGGIVGVHFAQIFGALGSKIKIYEPLPEILPEFDTDVVGEANKALRKKNVEVACGVSIDSIPKIPGVKTLICNGRKINTFGMEKLDLKMEGERPLVNEKMETSVPGIYAVGDMVSKKQFAHAAFEQGVVAAENALGRNSTFSYEYLPYAVYTYPEMAGVGLTEKEAGEKSRNINTGKFPYAAMGVSYTTGEVDGFVKVISDKNGKILGAHIFGEEAGTLIAEAAAAVRNGMTVEQLAKSFQTHPSHAEILQEANLDALGRSIHLLKPFEAAVLFLDIRRLFR